MVEVALLAARPQYRKKRVSRTSELSVGGNHVAGAKPSLASSEAPAMLVPSSARSRSVRETIQEVKMVLVCIFKLCSVCKFFTALLCHYPIMQQFRSRAEI